jgi:hypothetical protein
MAKMKDMIMQCEEELDVVLGIIAEDCKTFKEFLAEVIHSYAENRYLRGLITDHDYMQEVAWGIWEDGSNY